MNDQLIEASLQIAFEAGKWAGQVELEESYDKEQYLLATLEYYRARKTGMPIEQPSLMNRTVKVSLRSQEWREGVKKSSEEYLQRAKKIILENLRN